MKTRTIGILWIVCILFTWFLIAVVGAAVMSNTGAPEPLEGYFMSGLTDPTIIFLSILVGSISTPCCYCYSRDS